MPFVKTCQENRNVLKIGQKYQVTWRPKYIYFVGSSTKLFAAWQQCTGNPLLHVNSNNQQLYIVDNNTMFDNTMHFPGNAILFIVVMEIYIVPQYKRSTLLYFHDNTFSICILLIMTCNNSTKKKALLFPWLQWLCKHATTLQYMYILPHFPSVHFVRYFVTKILYVLHVWPSHSCAASIAASSSLLFNNIGKLHRDIFEEHYTIC